MVIFYSFEPFFGPNGTPLARRWTLELELELELEFELENDLLV